MFIQAKYVKLLYSAVLRKEVGEPLHDEEFAKAEKEESHAAVVIDIEEKHGMTTDEILAV